MKNILIIILLLAIPATGAILAQDVLVEYVEGVVDVRDGGAWNEVFIGDSVPTNATIRVGATGMVELRSAGKTFLLSQAGSYQLASIVEATQRNERVGVGAIARQRIRSFVGEQTSSDAVVAGVRASEAATRDEVDWAGGESVPELIAIGVSELDAGNYEDAYYTFYDAWEFAGSEELPRAQFYLGYSAYLIGEGSAALRYLRDPAPDPTTEYYDDHILTLAQIQVESFAFADAIDLLNPFIESVGAGDTEDADVPTLQAAYLLAGLAYDGLGDGESARDNFQAAYELDPESDNAAVATALIDSL